MFATIIKAAIVQGIPLLLGSTGEIITEKSGNLNLGIPGIMYMGGSAGIGRELLHSVPDLSGA